MKLTGAILLFITPLAWAQLTFDSTVEEVVAQPSAKRVSANFKFTNTGKEAIQLSHVDPDCSCISIEIKGGKLHYAPGESGVIRTEFNVGNSIGTVDQLVAVWLKDDPKDEPSINLTARITIPELVSVKPKSLKWPVGGDAIEKRIYVTMHHDEPIIVTKVASSSEDFDVKLETIEDGNRYEIVVKPKNIGVPGLAVLTIDTDCPVQKQQRRQAFAMILKP